MVAELLRLLVVFAERELSTCFPRHKERPPFSELVDAVAEAKTILDRYDSGMCEWRALQRETISSCIQVARALSAAEKARERARY